MESINLATLIVGTICGIGTIALIMWIVVVIRHPGYDSFRLDLVQAIPTQPGVTDSSQRSLASHVGK